MIVIIIYFIGIYVTFRTLRNFFIVEHNTWHHDKELRTIVKIMSILSWVGLFMAWFIAYIEDKENIFKHFTK